MAFFRKKPIVIEARQVPPSITRIDPSQSLSVPQGFCPPEFQELKAWIGDAAQFEFALKNDWFPRLVIETREGSMYANPGGWIIKGVEGEFYPCSASVLAASYEEVEP